MNTAVTFTQLNPLRWTALMAWPLKTERGVVELARGKLGVEQIATKLKINPEAVIKIGRRLGIYFPPIKSKRTARRKTK